MADLQFAAWAQPPLARGVGSVDGSGELAAAAVRPSVSVSGPAPFDVEGPALRLLGPDGVVGLGAGVIGRMDPPPGAREVEDSYLASVELEQPELPWLLTPARAGADDRLRPWLVLVVVETGTADPGPVSVLDASVDELPDLRDSWAWAHVQLPATQATPPPGLEGLVGRTVSRLLCPRRLAGGRHYRACVVPALVAVAVDRYAPAWDVTRPGGRVRLPVYHQWTFSTATGGSDFRELVTRLVPASADELSGLGARLVDVSRPWPADPRPIGPDEGGPLTVAVAGALGPPGAEVAGTASDEVLALLSERLRRHVEAPADRLAQTAAAGDQTGAVAPPLYGGRHRNRDRVLPPAVAGEPAPPDWVATLNLSVAARVAAGLGAEYVRANDEVLMAAAWEQLGAVREANRLRETAALAAAVCESTHRRHVAPLTPGEALALASPAAGRLRLSDGVTLSVEVAVSPLPDAAATPAFARFLRPAGRVSRAAGTVAGSVVDRGLRGEVHVPEPPAVLARLDVAGPPEVGGDVADVVSTARLAVDATATAWQVVRTRAVVDVAVANGLADAGGAAAAVLASLAVTDVGLARRGDVPALRTALAPRVGAVADALATVVDGVAGTASHDGRAVTPLGVQIAGTQLRDHLVEALRPGDRAARRVAARVHLPTAWERPGLDPVMASPDFPVPAALALLATDREWFLPGIGSFPDNRVTVLRPEPRFVEAYLAGLNHEMQRELRWREYPTDGRGTTFRRFWPRPDGGVDVAPLHEWTADLGANSARPAGGMTVLLVRGDVLRRFPDVVVAAAPAAAGGGLEPDPTRWLAPHFLVRVDDTTALYAFERGHDELAAGAGWFFVFQEHGYRMRFGFDQPAGDRFATWEDLRWPPEGADPPPSGAVPTDGRGFALGGHPIQPPTGDVTGARWATDAADVARIALQRPFRVAVHASSLLGRRP